MSRRRNKKVPLVPTVIAIFLVVLAVFGLVFFKSLVSPVSSSTERLDFVIEKGESVSAIADRLYQEGLVRSPWGFRLAVKKLGLDSKIQAGNYYVSPNMDAYELASFLTRGIADVKLTIPEGYRIEQIGETAEKVLDIPYSDFLKAAKGKEGMLFPDTYYLPLGVTATELVSIMQNTLVEKFGTLDQETITLASLVERETKGNDEKPLVAGILKKRLASSWPLELDATVQYVLGKKGDWWPNTTLLDRKTNSPYNTYLSLGLPPSPICNPGSASIEAALNPEPSDYWFYLHDKNGVIHYAVTNADHEGNIEKYIR